MIVYVSVHVHGVCRRCGFENGGLTHDEVREVMRWHTDARAPFRGGCAAKTSELSWYAHSDTRFVA